MSKEAEVDPGMLVVIAGKNKGAVFKLGVRNLTGGRDAGNLIQVIDPEVSRRHFLIRTTPKGYMISDLASANGTMVNDERVQAAYVDFGDVIKVGNHSLLMVESVDAVPDAVLGERVTDRGLSAVPTQFAGSLLADIPSTLEPEALVPDGVEPEEEASEPAAEPRASTREPGIPRLALPRSVHCNVPGLLASEEEPGEAIKSDDWPGDPGPAQRGPEVVDTAALSAQRTSEMDIALQEMGRMGEYLDMAIHIVSKSICPDRAVLLKKSAEGTLMSRKVYMRPNLGDRGTQVPPAIHLVKQAMRIRAPVLDNRLEASGEAVFPATALVVPVVASGTSLGVLYVDSFAGSHKMFVELDTQTLQKVAAVLARRWTSSS